MPLRSGLDLFPPVYPYITLQSPLKLCSPTVDLAEYLFDAGKVVMSPRTQSLTMVMLAGKVVSKDSRGHEVWSHSGTFAWVLVGCDEQ